MGPNPDRPHRLTPAQANHRRAFNRELRAAFLAGAEERSVSEQGRGLTDAELRGVLRRYPGDLPAK